MAIRKIVTIDENEELLRKKSKPVTSFDQRLATLIDDMYATMLKADGVGLAAIQVGILKRVVVIETQEDGYYEFVNPVIVEQSKEENTTAEGCLSVPGKMGMVSRPQTVKVKYQDRNGNPLEKTFNGFTAKAVCHELDHLDGIVYIDKAVEVEEEE